MFKENKQHLQPYLISNINDLPEKQKSLLENSWSGTFYKEVFSRIEEQTFSVLYVDFPSRPNAPVNELTCLEILKAGQGWTDEEMWHHYLFDLQTRYALGLEQLGEAHFDLRTVYNFRERLSRYMQETGINLLDQAFAQVTDEQIEAFQIKTGQQRMDSTQVASNIRQMGRFQLLVTVLQRVPRMLSEEDQEHYAETLAPYTQGHAGQYVYHLKGEEVDEHLQRIGALMQQLLVGYVAVASQWDYRYQSYITGKAFAELDLFPLSEDSVIRFSENLAFMERMIYWFGGWHVFNDFPFGVGLGNTGFFFTDRVSGQAFKSIELRNLIFRAPYLSNTKNLWVWLLSETGFPGLVVFLVWLIVLWRSTALMRKRGSGTLKIMGLAGQLFLLAYLLEGFSMDSFAMPYQWLMAGLISAGGMWVEEDGGGGGVAGQRREIR